MKSQIIFSTLLVVSFLLISSNVLAVPTTTWSSFQSIRPGTSGTVTVTVTNQENTHGERGFTVCIQPVSSDQSYVTGSCDPTTIQTLNFGQSGTVTLSYSVSNDAPTPSSPPVSITLTYQYSQLGIGDWFGGSGSFSTNIQVSGISIKDDANQKISTVGTQISSVQNTITTVQGALTTAQNMVTTAQSQNKDVSTATSDLSNAQSSSSGAQSSLSSAQTEYSQAQSYYASNDYTDSLNSINLASSNAGSASNLANSANQYALQAQTDVTNAGCISGYVMQSGQCVQQTQNPNPNPVVTTQPNPNPNPQPSPDNTSLLIVGVIIVLGIIGIWYYNNNKKKETKHHAKQKSKSE